MKIEIIKDTEDIRENRTKILKKGTVLVCSNELAKEYIKKRLAKKYEADIKPRKPLKNVADVEDFEDNNIND